jgi:adenosylmethionine-8-amino-7-oxononanoate aminotransferase
MIIAFDVDTTDPEFSRRFYRAALDREALIRPIGNTVYLMPPYIINDEEITHLGQTVSGALNEALSAQGPARQDSAQ